MFFVLFPIIGRADIRASFMATPNCGIAFYGIIVIDEMSGFYRNFIRKRPKGHKIYIL